MTHNRQFALVLALGLAPFLTMPVAAQTADAATSPAPAERYYLNLSGGYQAKSQTISESGSFDIYEEDAQYTVRQEIKGGGLVDIAGGARFTWMGQRLGAGISYSQRVKTTDDITADVTVPHPLFAAEPRSASVRAGGAGYSERAVHLQALWFVPVTVRFDVAFFIGPSFFSVDVDGASIGPENVQEGAFPFDTVSLSGARISGRSDSAVGFNIGADGTYLVTRHIGGGLFLRYSRASVDVPAAGGGNIGIDAGGFEVGGGVRVRF